MNRQQFLQLAQCVNADFRLFDAITVEDAKPALLICQTCKVWWECEDEVRPTEFFDGVCAGAVWDNGRIVGLLRKRLEYQTARREKERGNGKSPNGRRAMRDDRD